jgi:hypothetical protein
MGGAVRFCRQGGTGVKLATQRADLGRRKCSVSKKRLLEGWNRGVRINWDDLKHSIIAYG